jgi:hypothetical protein
LGRDRSRRHSQKPEAKKKKELRNAQRSFPVGFDDATPSPDATSSPGVDPSPSVSPSLGVGPSRYVDDAPVNGERPDTVRGGMSRAGLVLHEASVVNCPILPYAQMVVSLIVGKRIGKDELVKALLKIVSQRSIDNRTSTQYVSPFHGQHPP